MAKGARIMVCMAKAQVSVELAMMASVTMAILLVAYLVNDSLSSAWEGQRQKLQAGFAADRLAIGIGKAVSGGDGATVRFLNSVLPDVTVMEISENRSVVAYTIGGASATAPLSTSNISVPSGIPINSELVIRNSGGAITIEAP